MKKTILLLIVITTISFLQMDCKDDEPIKPCTDCPQLPDTTSENFTLTTWEYGNGFESAYAKDTWVFNKNNILAVGLFPGFDSANPQNSSNVNIIRWDGVSWKPFQNNETRVSSGINSIYALDTSQMYFGAGGGMFIYKNGVISLLNMNISWSSGQSIDYVWASSESNVWGVGKRGLIVHYDGVNWKKIPFDSNFNFIEITGSMKTGVAFASVFGQQGTRLVRLITEGAVIISETTPVQSLNLFNENTLWVGGLELRSLSLSDTIFTTLRTGDGIFVNAASMTSQNDIYFLCEKNSVNGWRQFFMHYNGGRFSVYNLTQNSFYINHGTSAANDVAVIAAETNNKALIITLRRN